MSDDSSDEPDAMEQRRRTKWRKRARVVVVCSAIVVVIDTLLSCLLIPWVDRQDWAITRYGSVGYVIYFVMVFFTFIAALALVGYLFSRSSYPSDEWR